MSFREENFEDQGRARHGSPTFYNLLEEMAQTHDRKSHDYASNENPYGNYHFGGKLALLFSHSEQDAGFISRLGEKFYRLANLESSGKIASNESIEDTERDIAVITALWMADRRDRRVLKNSINQMCDQQGSYPSSPTDNMRSIHLASLSDEELYKLKIYYEELRNSREENRKGLNAQINKAAR